MNKNLEHLLEVYATQPRSALREALAALSRETLEATFIDLLTLYLNDANSSTVREWITLHVAGYQPVEGKLGYNGYRMVGPHSEQRQFCEVKPINARHKADGKLSRRLNGGGNFSDYTPERLKKHLKEPNLRMLVSGFVDRRLMYVLEFPFKCLEKSLRSSLEKKFPDGERAQGDYLRSASFTFRDYGDCDAVKLVYVIQPLSNWERVFTKEFFKYLQALNKAQGEKNA